MSDTPQGSDWWRAGDGKWYPAPPGLSDTDTAPAPTPPPDHDPVPPAPRSAPFSAGVYRAGRVGTTAVAEPPERSRRRAVGLAAIVAVLVIGLIAGMTALVADDSSKRASSDDPTYQQAIVDLLGSERTNLVFLQTFWESYRAHQSSRGSGPGTRGNPGAATGSRAIDAGWFDDMEAQVDQFSDDLVGIVGGLDDRPWRDGTVADHIRDLARRHYEAWLRWTNDVPTLAEQWLAAQSPLDLQSWIDRTAPQLDVAIETTFDDLCAALETTAPSDHHFDSTIETICTR